MPLQKLQGKSVVAVNSNKDMLRVPTEYEIFGGNVYGQKESEKNKHWKSMGKIRNRMAFKDKEGNWEWYWLMNRHKEYASQLLTTMVLRPSPALLAIVAFACFFAYNNLKMKRNQQRNEELKE